jgi:alpha-amylase/alpha-mannosidase (GH57 family)
MEIWHLTEDAPRSPHRVLPDESVTVTAGTWPTEPGQSVWVEHRVERPDGTRDTGRVQAAWRRNEGPNSYWQTELGPFRDRDRVTYTVRGRSPAGEATTSAASFRVGARLALALLWHQHQPAYKDVTSSSPVGSYRAPWVRLHAIRDYYSMAALLAEHPGVHLTINLTPVLLWQLREYADEGATDRALDLTLRPAEELDEDEREQVLATFFDADWHNQILRHPRYAELFGRRRDGHPFSAPDLRDLQMWANLAWFGEEFRTSSVSLPTGESASVRHFVEQGRGFSVADVRAMVAEQLKIIRAVIPIHRELRARGQIEVATSPFAHPILPLLLDTDRATVDRPGATRPPRFARPDDAEAQVRLAVEEYRRGFGEHPRGMWPAEGAVSPALVPLLARHGVRWIASDGGVLARSGRYGYDAADPNVLCRPYRVREGGRALSIFFRDTDLSDAIGFRYAGYADQAKAARILVGAVKARLAQPTGPVDDDRILTLVLDGENAWGSFPKDGRPFLHELYRLLDADRDVATVTFSEYLDGAPDRGLAPHPVDEHEQLHELHTGSWIDEQGSAPGVDLGTWIGEPEENRAWELLGRARAALDAAGATPERTPQAFRALYLAEGSDWFWWLGEDQESGNDSDFDDLFRQHLRAAYWLAGAAPPADLDRPIVPRAVTWSYTKPVTEIAPGDRLTVRTNCPGILIWRCDVTDVRSASLAPAGGVMDGARRHRLTLGPFPPDAREVRFSFVCGHPGCDERAECRAPSEHVVVIADLAPGPGAANAGARLQPPRDP